MVYGHLKRVCTESGLWEKNPLPQRGIEPASAACWSDAVPTELHPHSHGIRSVSLFQLLSFMLAMTPMHGSSHWHLFGRCVSKSFSQTLRHLYQPSNRHTTVLVTLIQTLKPSCCCRRNCNVLNSSCLPVEVNLNCA